MQYEALREALCRYGRRMYQEGLVSCTSGNLSVRIPDHPQWMAITPGSESYDTMTADRIVILDLDGTVIDGPENPSSEWRMHAGIYRARPDITAIVHTHSAYATAFAVLNREIPEVLAEMRPWLGGSVQVAPYTPMGTFRMAELALEPLRQRHGCLLGNHGVLAVADSLDLAYTRAAYIEDAARIYQIALTVGQPVVLPEARED